MAGHPGLVVGAIAALLAGGGDARAGCDASSQLDAVRESLQRPIMHVVVKRAQQAEAGEGREYKLPELPDDPTASAEVRAMRRQGVAIAHGDIEAFRRGVPADPGARREWMLRSFALETAASSASLAIIEQILQWHPDLVAAPDARKRFSAALESLARNWQSRAGREREGWRMPAHPSRDDMAQAVRLLLEWGADPQGHTDWLSPLGVLAVTESSPQAGLAASYLLEKGASIESKDGRAAKPLLLAAENRNGAVAAAIVKQRRIAQSDLDEALALTRFAARNGAVTALLDAGANINMTTAPRGFWPAAMAAARFRNEGDRELMDIAIRYKADPNRHGPDGSPLIDVVSDAGYVRALLDLGANPHFRDERGANALMVAGPQDEESMRILLARGAKVELTGTRWADPAQTPVPVGPVSWALLHNNERLAMALLGRDGLGESDCAAAYYAAQTGSVRVLAALRPSRGQLRDIVDYDNRTPFAIAARSGRLDVVRWMLDNDLARADEKTPVSIRIRKTGGGHPGFSIPGPTRIGGETALSIALAAGQDAVAQELRRRGARD